MNFTLHQIARFGGVLIAMLDKYVHKSKEIAARKVSDEFFILTLEDGTLHRINAMGEEIWEIINGRTTVREIIKQIITAYNVEANTAHIDVVEFIQSIIKKGIIFLTDSHEEIDTVSADPKRNL